MLEVLLTVAVMGLIAGMGTPIYQAFQNRNDLDIAATSLAQGMRRAQILSRAVDGDTSWGMHVATGTLTLFRGVSYASRTSTFDETTTIPSGIRIAGLTDIVFGAFTGEPQTTGTTTLTSETNETRTITINAKGMVSF